MPAEKIPLIGIVGGIASGKSFVSQQFGLRGAAVISADQLAHQVLKLPGVKSRIRKRWGDQVFTSDGQIDRSSLAKIVFAPPPEGPAELEALEQITHPTIGRLAREELDRLQREGRAPAIVLDVPLMLESGWNKFCDKIVFVDAPRRVRLARALKRGWTREDFEHREAAQKSLESKREIADCVLDNSDSVESLQEQVQRIWPLLVGP